MFPTPWPTLTNSVATNVDICGHGFPLHDRKDLSIIKSTLLFKLPIDTLSSINPFGKNISPIFAQPINCQNLYDLEYSNSKMLLENNLVPQ